MLYQLPTGKVIEISTEQFLEMSDEELEYLIAYNGDNLEDPWFGSILKKREIISHDDEEEITPNISDNIPSIDKLTDLDIDSSLIEE